jgi:hypothetical protein
MGCQCVGAAIGLPEENRADGRPSYIIDLFLELRIASIGIQAVCKWTLVDDYHHTTTFKHASGRIDGSVLFLHESSRKLKADISYNDLNFLIPMGYCESHLIASPGINDYEKFLAIDARSFAITKCIAFQFLGNGFDDI